METSEVKKIVDLIRDTDIDELYWEWVADFPEDLYSVEYVNNLIRRLNNERL